MRTTYAVVLATVVSAPQIAAEEPAPLDVDAVIERHVEALGGRVRIDAIENLVYGGGQYVEGDYRSDGTAAMSLGRPYFKLVGDKRRPGAYMEGYDGSAWEWFADPGVVVRTVGAASEAIRHYAGVESPLVDYREKGSTARLLGEMTLDDRPVVAVELTRRDGFVEQLYFDTESWLIVASGRAAPIHAFGDEVRTLTRISDYREVGGVLLAHRFVSVKTPSMEETSSMQWGKVEANRDLPADWFSPPEFERSSLQAFIEHLYGQRADIDAVLWTYHEFRRAHPGVDSSSAVDVAGFQMLKMGAVDTAVTLLEHNVEAYPDCADCQFGLGRALRTADREDVARAHFEHALQLDPEHGRARRALSEMSGE